MHPRRAAPKVSYFLFRVALPLVGLLPERRTGTLEMGMRVRGGGMLDLAGGAWDVGLGADESSPWLDEWGGGVCRTLTGILESRGRLVLPLMEWNEEEEEDGACDCGLRFTSPVEGDGELISSSSEPAAPGLSGS